MRRHTGLTTAQAAQRLLAHGPNVLPPPVRAPWWRQLVVQVAHPLALVLWLAAGLAAVSGAWPLAVAIVGVIVLNAGFAVVQEHQAERAVEALAAYLPERAVVVRDGVQVSLPAAELVPGDLVLLEEGERVPADARLVEGSLLLDLSSLTGESAPVSRFPDAPRHLPLLQQHDLAFSGCLCTGGSALATVTATGADTEMGRIAALSSRTRRVLSPLEKQITAVAWLIARIGVAVAVAFVPLGLLAGLSVKDASLFAIGLLVANVPEGLLPTITLALAVGVRSLAQRGAVVKRLSAVETLGSTTVICTDKTGTLTQNRMRVVDAWLAPGAERAVLVATTARCTLRPGGARSHDPTESAVEQWLAEQGVRDVDLPSTSLWHPFDPVRKTVSVTVPVAAGWESALKGAPESLLERSHGGDDAVRAAVEHLTGQGLRVLAVAWATGSGPLPRTADEAERDVVVVGLLALHDPPREAAAAAVAACHSAGMRLVVVTGDHPATAAYVAEQVGIGTGGLLQLDGPTLDRASEHDLDGILGDSSLDAVIARSTPETKLRVAASLQRAGEVVAMTGDGVNDAPALRRADIGIAMGRSGTDVAREAASMVLTDDDFATIPRAVAMGRQVYDDVRKFVLYIFAHAVPEVLPFLVFALSGGAIPLPLTVLQMLAIDLGTETLPALALGREPAEPDVMQRPPRPRTEGVVTRELLVRAWLFLGLVSAVLVLAGFLVTLLSAGWHPGDPVDRGTALHPAYLRATTMSFAGIVACQVGTALAARTEHSSLRAVGLTSNPLLLWGIGFELLFSAAVVYVPFLQQVFGTAALRAQDLVLLIPFPFVVWGADELRKARRRSSAGPDRRRQLDGQQLGDR
jgi:calcium-translocating P-type ATPase